MPAAVTRSDIGVVAARIVTIVPVLIRLGDVGGLWSHRNRGRRVDDRRRGIHHRRRRVIPGRRHNRYAETEPDDHPRRGRARYAPHDNGASSESERGPKKIRLETHLVPPKGTQRVRGVPIFRSILRDKRASPSLATIRYPGLSIRQQPYLTTKWAIGGASRLLVTANSIYHAHACCRRVSRH